MEGIDQGDVESRGRRPQGSSSSTSSSPEGSGPDPQILGEIAPQDLGALAVRSIYNTGWPWPLDAVQGWFESVLNGIRSAINAVVSSVVSALRSVWDGLLNTISGGITWIKTNLTNVADWVWTKLQAAWDGIIKALSAGVDWIKTNLTNVATWVWEKLSSAWDAIIKGLSSAVTWIKDNLANVADWVWAKLSAAWDGIIKGISSGLSTLSDWAKSAIAGLYGIAQKSWDVLGRIGAIVMDSVGGVVAGLLGALGDLFKSIAGSLVSVLGGIANGIISLFSWVADKVKEGILSLYNWIMELAPRNAEEVPKKLPALLGTTAVAGFGVTLALDAAGVKIAGSGFDLDGLKKYLGDIFSPGLVQGVLIGAIVSSGITPFVQRWVRTQFRSWMPEPEQAYILFRSGYFTEAQYRNVLAQWGVPEELMSARTELADYTPGLMELTRIAQYSDIDMTWLEDKMKENGVPPDDVPKFKEMFLNISLRRVQSEIYSGLEKSIDYGIPSREEFDRMLLQSQFRDFIRPYYLMIFDIVLAHIRTKWWVDAWEEQLYRKLITPDAFVDKCLTLGMDKQIAVARAMKQMARIGVYYEMPA